MTPYQGSAGPTLEINFKLLGTSLCACFAWAVWPSTPEWWGLGLLSILMGLGAFALLIDALMAMARLYKRDKAVADYVAQGTKPKTAELASKEALQKAGMIDGRANKD